MNINEHKTSDFTLNADHKGLLLLLLRTKSYDFWIKGHQVVTIQVRNMFFKP